MFQFQAFQTNQVTITGTATQIVAAFSSRSGIVITNLGTTDVYIGENANVTTSTGHLLPGTKGASLSFSTTGAIYGITGGSSQAVSYLQTN
jgi:hypothetical protein